MEGAAPQALYCSRHPGKYPFCQDLAKVHVTDGYNSGWCQGGHLWVKAIIRVPAGSISQLCNPCQNEMLDLLFTDNLPDTRNKLSVSWRIHFFSLTWQRKWFVASLPKSLPREWNCRSQPLLGPRLILPECFPHPQQCFQNFFYPLYTV